PDARYSDGCSPPACPTELNDMGAYGGPGACGWQPDPCGNGTLDAGEECDDGNLKDGDCCSAGCTLEPRGTACDDNNGWTDGDTCDGAGTCQGTPNSAPCDDGAGCNGTDTCSGGRCSVHSDPAACTFPNDGCTTHVTGPIDCERWTAAGSPYCVDGNIVVT